MKPEAARVSGVTDLHAACVHVFAGMDVHEDTCSPRTGHVTGPREFHRCVPSIDQRLRGNTHIRSLGRISDAAGVSGQSPPSQRRIQAFAITNPQL
jgi:hypothetical protein